MSAREFSYEVIIREHHLDTFGHVNNAAYFEIFEEARWELIVQGGFSIENIQKTKIGPTVLGTEAQFKRELKAREKITIKTQMTDYKGKVGHLRQIMYKESGEEACVATFAIGLFDLNLRKLILPTPEWIQAIGWSPSGTGND